MKRQQISSVPSPPIEDGLIFYASLTTNSIDIIGNKTSIRDAISYNSNGAYFNDSSSNDNNLKYLCYEISEYELKSIKTIYCEIMCTSSKYDTQTIYCLGTNRSEPYTPYNMVVGDGVLRQYRQVWHNKDSFCYKYSSINPPSTNPDWRYDVDKDTSTIISSNVWYKLVGCTYSNKQFTYCNGIKNYETSYQDNFIDFDITQSPQNGKCYLTIGGRTFFNQKQLNGYVRNLKMWTKEFTNEELINMTT